MRNAQKKRRAWQLIDMSMETGKIKTRARFNPRIALKLLNSQLNKFAQILPPKGGGKKLRVFDRAGFFTPTVPYWGRAKPGKNA
jgi:hypothetical protein